MILDAEKVSVKILEEWDLDLLLKIVPIDCDKFWVLHLV
jgi:hypothetical protein